MIPNRESLGDIGSDLVVARAKIVAIREALKPALDRQNVLDERFTTLVANLDRMAAELYRVEGTVESHLPVAAASGGFPVLRHVDDLVEVAAFGTHNVEYDIFRTMLHRINRHG